MGFDSWGTSRVVLPTARLSDEQQLARIQAEQRADSRALPGGQRSRRSSKSGSLTATDFSVAEVDLAYTEIEVDDAGLYIVRAKATVTGTAGSAAWMEVTGGGSGSDWIDTDSTPIPASATSYPIGVNATTWCEAGVTVSSTITGATVADHSLQLTLLAFS